MKKKNEVMIKTGLSKLDGLIGGFNRGELAIIGGRPSMGKTAFLHTIINNGAVESKGKIYIVCFEPDSSTLETRLRLDCINARVDIFKATQWCATKDEFRRLKKAHKEIFHDSVISLYNWPAVAVLDRLLKEAVDISKRAKLNVIAIDYLQLINAGAIKNPRRYRDMTKVCASLKKMAERLNVAIILLSQLPRSIERRGAHMPKLSDLKKYGAIEKYADKVLFIYREEYYEPTDKNRGIAKIIVAKNTGGQVGAVDMRFIRSYLRFDNI